jgi:hypothetical protein
MSETEYLMKVLSEKENELTELKKFTRLCVGIIVSMIAMIIWMGNSVC